MGMLIKMDMIQHNINNYLRKFYGPMYNCSIYETEAREHFVHENGIIENSTIGKFLRLPFAKSKDALNMGFKFDTNEVRQLLKLDIDIAKRIAAIPSPNATPTSDEDLGYISENDTDY